MGFDSLQRRQGQYGNGQHEGKPYRPHMGKMQRCWPMTSVSTRSGATGPRRYGVSAWAESPKYLR